MDVGICDWIPTAVLSCQPPVAWLTTAGAFACLLLLGDAGLLSIRIARRTPPEGRGVQWARPFLRALTALLLLAALSNPGLVSEVPENRHQVVLLIDVSDSQRRDPDRFQSALLQLARTAELATRQAGKAKAEFHLAAFADGARVVHQGVSSDELPAVIKGLLQEQLPNGGESDLEAGIDGAIAHIDSLSGLGQIVLWSDGLETRGEAEAAAVRAGRRGIPIITLGHVSSAPGVGLYGSYLPELLSRGEATETRLLLRNPGGAERRFVLSAGKNGVGMAESRPESVKPRTVLPVSLSTVFQEPGLQFIDLALEFDGQPVQRERLFAQVNAPLRVLAIGPAVDWTAALGADFDVRLARADTAFEPTDFDVVVLSGAPAGSLPAGQIERLADAVRQVGVGLMLVNGPHRGASDAPTVVGSYKGTALEPLLPVRLEPRSVREEPPPRQVIFVIDVSGSMKDSLDLAKAQASHIIRRLRPMDTAQIRSFSDSDDLVLDTTQMSARGRDAALAAIAGLSAGGGTSPGTSYDEVRAVSVDSASKCGLFFMTDGEFNDKLRAVGCLTTIFVFDKAVGSVDSQLGGLGDLHYMQAGQGPRSVELQFFQPEERKQTYAPTAFVPDWLDTGWLSAPSTRLMLPGNAVTFRRLESETVAVRPYPLDPLLAFQSNGTGVVGVFTSELTPEWYGSSAGSSAIEGWLKRMTAWSERDRYSIQLAQRGRAISMRVTLLSQHGELPDVDTLAGRLILADATSIPVPLQRDSDLFGVFRGRIDLPADAAGQGFVELVEGGAGALGRAQRIPMRLPGPLSETAPSGIEASIYGLNDELLRRLSSLTGGRFEAERWIESFEPPRRPTLIWPWLVAGAALAFLADIAIARFLR